MEFIVAATEDGLSFVGSKSMGDEALEGWMRRKAPAYMLIQDDDKCKSSIQQLTEYLTGQCTTFTVPLHMRGTPFQLQVWEALRTIPYGQTRSYLDIARQIGKPSSVRAVGAAIGANPLLIFIPCHRVIAKSGSLTGYRGGLDMKAKLLQLEGSIH